jgi:hypothetical protein
VGHKIHQGGFWCGGTRDTYLEQQVVLLQSAVSPAATSITRPVIGYDVLGWRRQEIEILRSLEHPNIIQMLDSFETPSEFCVVTEFAQVRVPPDHAHAARRSPPGARKAVVVTVGRC